jgi:secreted trypsin-like serine protease
MYTFVALMLLAVANADDRIVNGGDVTGTSQSPWQVSLQQAGSHFCGASIISGIHVMSAGHCKITGAIQRTTIALEGTDTRSLAQQFKATSWVQHPDFTQTLLINYDFSVITLDGMITLKKGIVEAITLPTPDMVFTGDAWISGWGKLSGDNNILPTTLQIVKLPILSDEKCAETWGARRVTPQSICVGGEGHGACNGDSGGPLFQEVSGTWYLIGNTSWGASTCDANEYPTVYAKNSAVYQWIMDQM